MPLTVDNSGSGAKASLPDTQSTAATPLRIATPPPPAERVYLEAKRNVDSGSSRHSRYSARASDISGRASLLDADAVDHALRREMNRQQREGTPGASPHRKRQRINGDRWVI